VFDTEGGAGIALGVEVDDERLQALQRECRRDVHRRGRLPDTPLLVGDREDALARRPRKLSALRIVKEADGTLGFGADRGIRDRRGLPRLVGRRLPCFT
jgi:hypothetical protein